jgi:hypothetical protein
LLQAFERQRSEMVGLLHGQVLRDRKLENEKDKNKSHMFWFGDSGLAPESVFKANKYPRIHGFLTWKKSVNP